MVIRRSGGQHVDVNFTPKCSIGTYMAWSMRLRWSGEFHGEEVYGTALCQNWTTFSFDTCVCYARRKVIDMLNSIIPSRHDVSVTSVLDLNQKSDL